MNRMTQRCIILHAMPYDSDMKDEKTGEVQNYKGVSVWYLESDELTPSEEKANNILECEKGIKPAKFGLRAETAADIPVLYSKFPVLPGIYNLIYGSQRGRNSKLSYVPTDVEYVSDFTGEMPPTDGKANNELDASSGNDDSITGSGKDNKPTDASKERKSA